MRRLILAAAMLAACAIPAGAQDGNSEVQGFGGMTFGTSTFFGTSISSTFGGRVAFGLLPNLQAIAEGGRMTEIRPPFLNLLDFTPADLRISAWYGEGGVRFITSPYSHVRPYGEATAGFARLSTGLSGIDYGRADTIVDAALAFVDHRGAGRRADHGSRVPLQQDPGGQRSRVRAQWRRRIQREPGADRRRLPVLVAVNGAAQSPENGRSSPPRCCSPSLHRPSGRG
jgi:hypothetical protein